MALSIGELVGYVTLNTTGVKAGAATTAATMRGLGATMSTSGVRAGAMAADGVGAGMAKKQGMLSNAWSKAVGALAVGAAIKASVGLEASYSKTMALVAASTGAPQAEMAKLSALAMKLGADTSFSANDAAGAMLELGKAGISTSDIMGGALSGTLTLAAAGGTDLATAATIASNAMNTFGIKGKDMGSVAAALAGGANASSASVESLGQALQQVGPGAVNAGMTLQETIAALSAFDAAGIKGSDAGTSLKTMFTNLVPQTKNAATAMAEVGLFSKKTGSAFVNADGSFKSMTQVAQLLHKHLGGLSEAQRQQALTTIFGSDSARAASVLMKEGAAGIRKYLKATKDQTAAQKMAKANMSGTSGALERMRGSIETAGLAFGKLLAPATLMVTGAIGGLAAGAAKAAGFLSDNHGAAIALVSVIGALTAVTLAHNAAMAVGAAGGMAQWLTQTKAISAVTKVWTAVQWAFNAAMSANPLGLAVIGLVALGAAMAVAWAKSSTFRGIVTGALSAVGDAAGKVFGWFKRNWPLLLGILIGPVGIAAGIIIKHWDRIKSSASDVVGWIRGIPGKIGALGGAFGKAGRELLQGFVDGMKNAAGVIAGIAGNVWDAVKGLLNGAIAKINAALEFKISLPGKDLVINPPDIPRLATGGRGRANSPMLATVFDANEPETVLRDSQLAALMRGAAAAAVAAAGGGSGGREGPVIQHATFTKADPRLVAEDLWFLTKTRG